MGTHIPDDGLPAHERKVRVPATMLPELGALDISDFEAWLTERRTSPGDMLRIQTLDRYGVPSDDADFVGYLKGAAEPTSAYREPFFQELRDGVAAQMRWRNLHLIRQPLNDYLRYAFEWVYTYSAEAGQDIRVLDLDENPGALLCSAPATSGWLSTSMSRWSGMTPRAATTAKWRWKRPPPPGMSPQLNWPGLWGSPSLTGGQRTRSTGAHHPLPDPGDGCLTGV